MAKSVANLSVSVSAKTRKFRRGMKKSKTALQRFTQAVKSAAIRLAKFAAVVAAAAAVALVALVRHTLRAGDAMAKFADKVGITTEELAGLHHAARLSGVRIETLEMAMQRLTRRIGEASVGTGEAKAAIKELGLSAVKLKRMGSAKALREIADAMEDVRWQADRVRIMMKLVDSEGVSMVNTIRGGAAALDAAHAEAVQFGTAISRIDAAKLEAVNDEWMRLKAAITGLGFKLAKWLAPHLEAAIKLSADFIGKWSGFAISAMHNAIDLVIASIDKLIQSLRSAIAMTQRTGSTLFRWAASAASAMGLDDLATGLGMQSALLKGAFQDTAKSTQATPLRSFFKRINDRVQKAAEDVANSRRLRKHSFLTTILDSLTSFDAKSQKVVIKFGAKFGKLLGEGAKTNFMNSFGKTLSLFLGAAAKKPSESLANTFREVDPTRVAIGRAGKRKVQQVEDAATKKMVSLMQRQIQILENGMIGVAG